MMKEMKRVLLACVLLLLTLCVGAAGFNKATYYSAASGKKGQALKTALAGIIYTTNSVGYNGLKSAYVKTDKRDDGYLYDIYSNVTNYVPGSSFVSGYSKEGDGYNREHTIPQSIFNEATPMKADLYHVYPCDGFLNGERGNNCHGEVGTSCTESANNFSKWGAPSSSLKSNGCDETEVFEPNDIYKGDIARTYFYFVTCYQSKLSSFGAYGMFDKSTYPSFTNWAKEMLLEWSKNDPVSTKETKRTEAVYNTSQHNRNPFIDYPGLEQYIWGTYMNVAFDPDNYQNPYDTPTPVTPSISLSQTSATVAEGDSLTLTAATQNATGATVTWTSSNTSVATVAGGTVIALAEGTAVITAKIIVSGTPYSATCDVTVTRNATPPVVEGDSYVKVTSSADLTDGQYLIVCESLNLAMDGSLTADANSNTISVDIADNTIPSTSATDAASFMISQSGSVFFIKGAGGSYIGGQNNTNKVVYASSSIDNAITISGGNAIIVSNSTYLRYRNEASQGQTRFRYFKSANYEDIQLYKKVATETSVLLGDVNRDGNVTIADVTALVNIILGKATEGDSNNYDFKAANVNEDEDITIADVTALVNIILGKTN